MNSAVFEIFYEVVDHFRRFYSEFDGFQTFFAFVISKITILTGKNATPAFWMGKITVPASKTIDLPNVINKGRKWSKSALK